MVVPFAVARTPMNPSCPNDHALWSVSAIALTAAGPTRQQPPTRRAPAASQERT
jgi:hypothetical protein